VWNALALQEYFAYSILVRFSQTACQSCSQHLLVYRAVRASERPSLAYGRNLGAMKFVIRPCDSWHQSQASWIDHACTTCFAFRRFDYHRFWRTLVHLTFQRESIIVIDEIDISGLYCTMSLRYYSYRVLQFHDQRLLSSVNPWSSAIYYCVVPNFIREVC
jgi:hypothetical protein